MNDIIVSILGIIAICLIISWIMLPSEVRDINKNLKRIIELLEKNK